MMSKKEEHYSVEMTKEGDELLVAYWTFDTIEEARALYETLKKGCTAYNVCLEIVDNKALTISRFRMGDEFNPGQLHF